MINDLKVGPGMKCAAPEFERGAHPPNRRGTNLFKKLISTAAILGFAVTAAGPAFAQTAVGSVNINADISVVNSCQLSHTNGSDFHFPQIDAVDGGGLPADLLSTPVQLDYTCTNTSSTTFVGLDDTKNPSNSNDFILTGVNNPGNTVAFHIFQTAEPGNPLFDNGGGFANARTIVSATPGVIELQGVIPAGGGAIPADEYTDVVTATLYI